MIGAVVVVVVVAAGYLLTRGPHELGKRERSALFGRLATAERTLRTAPWLAFSFEVFSRTGTDAPNADTPTMCLTGAYDTGEFPVGHFTVVDGACDTTARLEWQLSGTDLFRAENQDPGHTRWRRGRMTPSVAGRLIRAAGASSSLTGELRHATAIVDRGTQHFGEVAQPDGGTYNGTGGPSRGPAYEFRLPGSALASLAKTAGGAWTPDDDAKATGTITVRLDDRDRLHDFVFTADNGDSTVTVAASYAGYTDADAVLQAIPDIDGPYTGKWIRLGTLGAAEAFLGCSVTQVSMCAPG